MGMMEGILKGVGQTFKETTARMAEENQRQSMLESRVYEALLSSDYPEVQELALQGMTEIASGKGGKKKGLMGFLGKEEPSPILASMGELFSGGKSVQAPKGAPTGETPAGVPFDEESPPSAAMVPETGPDLGGEQRRGIYKSRSTVAGETTTENLRARTEHLRSLGVSDEDIGAAMTGRQTATPGVDYQTVMGPDGKPIILALDDRTGQPMRIVGEAPPSAKAPGRPMAVRGKGGTYLLDPDTLEQLGFVPEQTPKPGEDPTYTRAKQTQKALQSHQDSQGFAFMGMTDDERAVFLDDFVRQYGGFANYGEYLTALSGGEAGGAPPSAGGFDINQVPETHRRFFDPTTGMPSQEADQRMQIIIEKNRAYSADPENNPPLDPTDVEFATFYEKYFLGRK